MISYILSWILTIYSWILIARMIGSWIEYANRGAIPEVLRPLWRGVCMLTDPPLRFLGRYIKPVRIGDLALDLGFVVLFVAVWAAQRLVWWLPF